ncbi:MAG: chemotaxis protein CheB [Sulfurimonadaceae bacterium]|jgi:two-component system CheB/CheR fusion protein|nr:chemotaxis protein CheB [Sulfurimonadaceae bacterium]
MSQPKEIIIVGIGSSAGGLEALQEFIHNLTVNDTMTYIVAQHLGPEHSVMVELLNKNSPLAVVVARDGLVVTANTIYITPPNYNITLDGDAIVLSAPADNFVGSKPSIDMFFESLAQSKHSNAVGIILSGTGSDGTRGCAQIKAQGGITIAQDPKSAKFDGMPLSAIDAGHIDIILPASEIALELKDIEKHMSALIPLEQITLQTKDDLISIFAHLKTICSIDFSEYKPTTLSRRIRRRMATLKILKIDEYVQLLYTDKKESANLCKDFLIGVTSFFRDKEAFLDLEVQLTQYLATKGANDMIKVWDVGCCTGEESYSIAIVIAEILAKNNMQREVQIFASDIDNDSILIARGGFYRASALEEMPPELLEKYFIAKDGGFYINNKIRDMIIFSKHNIVQDPPFIKLDLVVCRNLLIYFNSSLQERLIPMFHYALKNGGILFLGKTESIGSFENLFTPLTKNTRIFKREFSFTNLPPKIINIYHPIQDIKNKHLVAPPVAKMSFKESLIESLGEYLLPLSVIVSKGMDIVYIKEKNPYLHYDQGLATANIFKSIHEALSLDLRTLIQQCNKTTLPQHGIFHKVELFRGIERFVRLIVIPLSHHVENSEFYIISFQEEDADVFTQVDFSSVDAPHTKETIRLEAELTHTKRHLQTIIEEMEKTNEELQSLNEELRSANEELQSTNEELQSTNEELRSTNEELQSTNEELHNTKNKLDVTYDALKIVSEAKEVQQVLLNMVFDGITNGIVVYKAIDDGADFEIVDINTGSEKMDGLSRKDVIGKRIKDVFPNVVKTDMLDALARVYKTGIPKDIPLFFYGDKRMCVWRKNYIFKLPTGEVIAIYEDMTAYKNAEIALEKLNENLEEKIEEELAKNREKDLVIIKQSRFAAMGEMASNIAHQWRQPLNLLAITIQAAEVAYKHKKMDKEYIDTMVSDSMRMINRLSHTIDDFRNYFTANSAKENIEIAKSVHNTIMLLQDGFTSYNVAIEVDMSDDICIFGYKHEFEQAILSIINNAKEAIVANDIENGKISIKVQHVEDKIHISIENNGPKIDTEILGKIFDPYFTTKFKTQGTGLGLYMAKITIEQDMGGTLVVSNTSEGVCFDVELPVN